MFQAMETTWAKFPNQGRTGLMQEVKKNNIWTQLWGEKVKAWRHHQGPNHERT